MEKRNILYVLITIVCIISLGIGVYAQLYNTTEDKLMIGKKDDTTVTLKEESIKDDFSNIFNNSIIYSNKSITSRAIRADVGKDLVYTLNQLEQKETGKYEMNINVPTLNIVSSTANDINDEIETLFIEKARTILSSEPNQYTIYNIDYAAFVNDKIVSLVIRATLKEGNNPQRMMFMSYNYNIETQNIVKLEDLLSIKSIKKDTAQSKINKEISEISKQKTELKNIGYSVYTRDPSNKMYKVDNIQTYFLGADSYIYVLFPYGNNNNTSEVDVVLI